MLKVPSQIHKVETMSDGGLKLTVYTQELMSEDKAEVMGMHNKQGWFVFSDTGVNEADIPTEQVDFAGEKTPAQRMRNVLYRLWGQSTEANRGEFELFYRRKMETLTEKLKEKLL